MALECMVIVGALGAAGWALEPGTGGPIPERVADVMDVTLVLVGTGAWGVRGAGCGSRVYNDCCSGIGCCRMGVGA